MNEVFQQKEMIKIVMKKRNNIPSKIKTQKQRVRLLMLKSERRQKLVSKVFGKGSVKVEFKMTVI